jgi:nucleoside-diphosphate-sugar epimerase
MTVLITGGGLVGAQVARIEVDRGERPVILEVAPQRDALAAILDPERIRIVQGDVLNPLDLTRVIREENITHIIHTAANPMLTVGAQQNPYAAIHLNILGTANVLEAARVFGVRRVVLCSSSTLYTSMAGGEDQGVFMKEEAYPRPNTVYATTKQAGENLGLNYAQDFGLDFRAVRFAAVFGPWKGRGGGGGLTVAFRDLVEKAVKGEEVSFPVSAGNVMLVYSKDAAHGAVLACHTEGLKSRVFNLGMKRVYSAEDIEAAIRRVVPGARVTLLRTPGRVARAPEQAPRPLYEAGMNTDQTRAHAELGYEPKYDMEAALRDFAQFCRTTASAR